MRVTRGGVLLSAGALAVLAACARIEPPPGGPPDSAPPRLVSTSPDSMAVLPDFDGEVEFTFNEVVSEGGTASQGTGFGDLERLVVLSPTTRVPEVRWRRTRITVRPREGWEPNRVYRVELLPGISDLRNNRAEGRPVVVTFTTGAPVPVDSLRGRVWDWTTGRPAAGALIEASLLPDSLLYRFVADSAGRFVLAPLPAGTWLVTASLDPDRDRRRTGREPFDSVSARTAEPSMLELWTFPHDTTGPRIAELAVTDSLSVRLRTSQYLDPRQSFDSSTVSVRLLPDSTPIPVVALLREEQFDSLFRRTAAPPADSVAAPTDTVRRPAADTSARRRPGALEPDTARPSRATLSDRLILRLGAPLTPGASYFVLVRGLRNANGVSADAGGVLQVPTARAEPGAQPADSVPPRPAADSAPPPARK